MPLKKGKSKNLTLWEEEVGCKKSGVRGGRKWMSSKAKGQSLSLKEGRGVLGGIRRGDHCGKKLIPKWEKKKI